MRAGSTASSKTAALLVGELATTAAGTAAL